MRFSVYGIHTFVSLKSKTLSIFRCSTSDLCAPLPFSLVYRLKLSLRGPIQRSIHHMLTDSGGLLWPLAVKPPNPRSALGPWVRDSVAHWAIKPKSPSPSEAGPKLFAEPCP